MKIPPLGNSFRLAVGAALATPAIPALAASFPAIAGWMLGTPLALLGIAVPVLMWKFLESLPPKPRLVDLATRRFIPRSAIKNIRPLQMPWWQKAIFLLAGTAISVGLAHPQRVSDVAVDGDGPIVLFADNDWGAARNWSEHTDKMLATVDRTEGSGRPYIIVKTAPPADGGPVHATPLISATQARQMIHDMQPEAWSADRVAAAEALKDVDIAKRPSIVWFSNGLADAGSAALTEKLRSVGKLTVLRDAPGVATHLLLPPEAGAEKLAVRVRRADAKKDETIAINAYNERDSGPVGAAEAHFKPGETEAVAQFDLSREQRNQLSRLSLRDENSAGGVVLLDDRWQLRSVGIVKDGEAGQYHETHYIQAALQSYAILSKGSVGDLIKRKPDVIILPDSAGMTDSAHKELEAWIQEDGGTLLRFAGPNLAEQKPGHDTLIPVELDGPKNPVTVADGKVQSAKIAPFSAKSHFSGLKIPAGVVVKQEMSARPGPDLEDHVWASLDDGSALVTARQLGKGQVVMIHTSTDENWSNLAVTGGPLFIDMLRKIVSLSQTASGNFSQGGNVNLPPLKILNGFGQVSVNAGAVRPLTREAIESNIIGPHSPPGLYGHDSIRHAHNLAVAIPEMKPLPDMPPGVTSGIYEKGRQERDWPPGILLGGALALWFLDQLVRMRQQSASNRTKTPAGASQGPS